MMSGSELSHWAVTNPEKIRMRYYAIELGSLLGCKSVHSEAIQRSQEEMRNTQWRPVNDSDVPNSSYIPKPLVVPYSAQVDAYALVRCLRFEKNATEINEISR